MQKKIKVYVVVVDNDKSRYYNTRAAANKAGDVLKSFGYEVVVSETYKVIDINE